MPLCLYEERGDILSLHSSSTLLAFDMARGMLQAQVAGHLILMIMIESIENTI